MQLHSSRSDVQKQLGVLVVDDDESLLDEMVTTLADEGFSVHSATSGAEAIRHIECNPRIGVLLTDVRMPGMDGLQLIEELLTKLPAGTPGPQVIVLTGHGTMDTAVRALQLSADDFLCKPVVRADLVATIRRAMDRSLDAHDRIADRDGVLKHLSTMQSTLAGIKTTVNRFIDGDETPIEMGPAASDPLPAPAASPADMSARVRAMLHEHKIRARVFQDGIFVDPSWDMLLDLMLAHIEKREMYLTGLCAGSGLALTTALRRVEQLIAAGLVQRHDDPADRRRVIVSLTTCGQERLSAYLGQTERKRPGESAPGLAVAASSAAR
ncbi:response regulator [Reyranella sp. CPCC 100927]|nr:response regulator [Reyranella sp. CPCC 100927]